MTDAAGKVDIANFSSAARSALDYLHKTIGFELWMVTRVEGDDWIVLEAEDHGYGVAPQTVFRWTDSFCCHMVTGDGPRVAPCSADVPVYAEASIGRQVKIGAYIGVPLTNPDGTLFGTLCAIDPQPQPESIREYLPLVELIAKMLSCLLSEEMRSTQLSRQVERAQVLAEGDFLTGLYNRRGWDRAVSIEETRCRRYGNPACVMAIDLDDLKRVNDTEGHAAGDEMIVRAGAALREAVRKFDVVARVGGDEFVVLGVECDSADADALVERTRLLLDGARVPASIGMARRVPTGGLRGAADEADRRMYAEKRRRKGFHAARHQGFTPALSNEPAQIS